MPLSEIKNFVLSHEVLVRWGSMLSPYLIFIASIVCVLFLLVLGLMSVGIMFYLLFAALFVLLFSSLFKWHLSYKESYKAALHGATLPILISALLPLLNLSRPFLAFTLLLLLVVIFNMWNRPEGQISHST
jgi:hypothetical protein